MADLPAGAGGHPLQFPAEVATLLGLIHIAHGPYHDLALGRLCRLAAAVADITAGRHHTDPDHAQGHRLFVDVGVVAAVDNQATATTEGEAQAVEVMTATTVAAEVEAVSGAEDNIAATAL